MSRYLSPEQRIKINQETGCHEWLGAVRNKNGYGVIVINGVNTVAHRYFWEQKNGKIPYNLEIDHLCKNKLCCNTDHLELVTHKENVLRSNNICALNARKTHCPNGHELIPENCINRKNRISRECRICFNEKARIEREKVLKKAKARRYSGWTLN